MKIYFPRIVFPLVATAVMFQACKKDSASSAANPATQNIGFITFTLKTTDMQGNTASRFSVGQDFVPTLTISNSSPQQANICNCVLLKYNPDILGVYANTSEKYSDSALLIGKPWDGVLNYFILPTTVIPGSSEYTYAIPWIADTTTTKVYGAGVLLFDPLPQPPLPTGQYFIQFVFTYNNTPINLRYNFVVQ